MATGRVRAGWTPGSTNSAGQYSFGVDIVSDVDQAIEAIWWYQPATGTVTDLDAGFYLQSGPTLLRSGTMAQGAVTQGAWNKIMLGSPFTMLAGVTYTAKVSMAGEHAYEGSASYPQPPDPAPTQFILGRYDQNETGYPASDTWGGQHGIDVEMVDVVDINGTLSIVLPAEQSAFSASAVAEGVLSLNLPAEAAALIGSVPASGVLSLSLPAEAASLDGDLDVSGALNISLPTEAAVLSGGVVASGSLGISLPALISSLSAPDTTLPGSLREYVWRLLKNDPQMNAMGIDEASLFASTGPDSPDITIPATLQKWMVIRWGIEEARLGRDTSVRRKFLSIWGYHRQRYMGDIDEMLERAYQVLYPVKAVQFSSSGWIIEVTDNGLSEDVWEPAYAASTRNWQLTITASGV